MQVKQLKSIHAEKYRTLRFEALQQNPEAFASSYEEERERPISNFQERLETAASFTFGAFNEGELIGVVTLVPQTLIKMRHKGSIFAMYVTPDSRGSGAGRKLMEAAIEKAKEIDGLSHLLLTVVQSNQQAKKLYSSLGFVSFGIEKKALKLNGEYIDEEYMQLELD
ncbi:GNAT family N-acetyltransferase [Jeotgalibacillus sp. S-D1]|uniref:GNAT family N-acetyltransferase n=1 Tax=Jeotgalibacillus sp. S-D1 TaxID=2552189 RepID=UPI001059A1C4|nr:GNAT family N-acetyltransferase [Jeotgalibacillus sp. S-D1]TDL31397.1 GNAT family N-acetyltransferase [Jeotgalibacillus sp. S-D1]